MRRAIRSQPVGPMNTQPKGGLHVAQPVLDHARPERASGRGEEVSGVRRAHRTPATIRIQSVKAPAPIHPASQAVEMLEPGDREHGDRAA